MGKINDPASLPKGDFLVAANDGTPRYYCSTCDITSDTRIGCPHCRRPISLSQGSQIIILLKGVIDLLDTIAEHTKRERE